MSKSLRAIVVASAALVVMLAMASVAFAVAAKFHSATGSVNSSGALVVSFDERGLGAGNIDYTLTADATALYACIMAVARTRRRPTSSPSKARSAAAVPSSPRTAA
jgi:hypothetical protein